jgi:adenine-specific DNA methylase
MASDEVNDTLGKLIFITTETFLFEISERELFLRIMIFKKDKTVTHSKKLSTTREIPSC